jgi:outer membrane protein assembly factor BamB
MWRVTAWAPGTQFVTRLVTVEDGRAADVDIDLPEAVLWKYVTGDKIYRSAAAADLDGDGFPDVVVPSKDGKLYAINGKTGKVLWFQDTRNASHTDPVILDIENANQPDVIFGVGAVGLQCLRGRDGGARFFLKEADAANRTYVAAANVECNRDGYSDLVLTNWSGRLSLISGKIAVKQFQLQPLWSRDVGSRIEGAAMVGDANADVVLDVAVVTHAPRLVVLTLESGEELWTVDLPAAPSAQPVMADLDGDGAGDIAVPLADGRLVAISVRERKILWTFAAGARIRTRPAVGDLDGDGQVEIVFGSDDAHVYALDGKTGALKWKFRAGQEVHGSPAIGDVDGDGRPDVVVGAGDNRIVALDGRTGAAFWWFPEKENTGAAPLLVDLDYDGAMEIVVGSGDNYIYALKVGKRR